MSVESDSSSLRTARDLREAEVEGSEYEDFKIERLSFSNQLDVSQPFTVDDSRTNGRTILGRYLMQTGDVNLGHRLVHIEN